MSRTQFGCEARPTPILNRVDPPRSAARHFAAKFLLVLLCAATVANAQALFTGETGGKGTSSVIFTANAIRPADFTTLANFWAAYTVGVHNRVDAFVLYGNSTALGLTQHFMGVGSNIGILKRDRSGLDVSFLTIFSFPFNYRDQASTVLATLAPIASRPIRLGGYTVTPYGGYLLTEPIGQRAGKLFSPPGPVHNGIIGAVLPCSRQLSFIVEYNPGRSQQNLGFGVLYIFPQ